MIVLDACVNNAEAIAPVRCLQRIPNGMVNARGTPPTSIVDGTERDVEWPDPIEPLTRDAARSSDTAAQGVQRLPACLPTYSV